MGNAVGSHAATKPISKESDGKRPSGAAGAKRKTRVDWEAQKRLDPVAAEEDLFVVRESQDEIRSEVEREAHMPKAYAKLEERRSAGPTEVI